MTTSCALPVFPAVSPEPCTIDDFSGHFPLGSLAFMHVFTCPSPPDPIPKS